MKFLVLCALATLAAADYRVEYKLVDYNNPGSVLADGKTKCERSAPCDPKLVGEVDVDTAMNAFPDARSRSKWVTIFEKKSTDRSSIGKTVSRDKCKEDRFKKANLRVVAVDVNKFGSDKEIQQWECMTGGSSMEVSRSESSAKWSSPKMCDAKYTKSGNAQLAYQWRAFNIPSSTCGRPPK